MCNVLRKYRECVCITLYLLSIRSHIRFLSPAHHSHQGRHGDGWAVTPGNGRRHVSPALVLLDLHVQERESSRVLVPRYLLCPLGSLCSWWVKDALVILRIICIAHFQLCFNTSLPFSTPFPPTLCNSAVIILAPMRKALS